LWWGSAPALDHRIGLANDIAHRLTAQRWSTTRTLTIFDQAKHVG
jgi:hypothetical protein